MRNTSNGLVAWARQKMRLHPTWGQLVALLDGELTPTEEAVVKSHLARCQTCQREAEGLEKRLQLFEQIDAHSRSVDFPLEHGLHRLRSAIQVWNAANPEPQAASNAEWAPSAALYEKLVTELGIYVGARAARTMLKPYGYSGLKREKLTAAVEPIVTDFLGREQV